MVAVCSHLFWPDSGINSEGVERFKDSERVLECLKRSLRIASTCNPQLYIDIIDRYYRFGLISIRIIYLFY